MINHPNRSNLFTVLRPSGEVEERHCTVAQAAEIVLGYDGAIYEIRRGDGRHDVDGEAQWELFSRSLNGRWARTSSVKPFYAATADAAWPLIAREVLRVCGSWHGPEVMTDADYDAMIAGLE